jgi:hypothetical protein
MEKVVYILKKKKDTEELHLFEAVPKENNICVIKGESICGKMKKGESSENIFMCKSEDYTRTECARKGRQVCGICVSHLYATYR